MLTLGRFRLIGFGERFLLCRSYSSSALGAVEDFTVKNEPVLEYRPGSKEREQLQAALSKWSKTTTEIPVIIGDKEYKDGDFIYQLMPHNRHQKLAKVYQADKKLLGTAIDTALQAQKKWAQVPWQEKIKIFQRAAEMIATKYRFDLNAATMLGQSKTVVQAEIDSACELADFFNFNTYYLKEMLKYQPISVDPKVTLNSVRFRGLEGFVAAISPFNFTAIGGNLAYAPALMGCVVLWKPSDTAALSNYLIFKIMQEAGLPPGVVNFVPAVGTTFGDTITSHPNLAAINFTGSARTFEVLWKLVGNNVSHYKSYPRLIGECGGKNFHFIHPSADVESASLHTIRSAFEYQGQKCSACSRLYVPASLWPKIKSRLLEVRDQIKVGDPADLKSFMGAVIDETAFKRIKSYIDLAKKESSTTIIAGGDYSDEIGYFIQPTIIESTVPDTKQMTEEIFGPVLTVYVYKDSDVWSTLEKVNTTTPYALTGAIFASDREFIAKAHDYLIHGAGNFYINDKSTGAVVAQQPFGGARKSGTNDKAGGPHYLLRFTSIQAVKETFVPLKDWQYPYMK